MGHECEEKKELLWFEQIVQNAVLSGEVWGSEVQNHVLAGPPCHIRTCLGHNLHESGVWDTDMNLQYPFLKLPMYTKK